MAGGVGTYVVAVTRWGRSLDEEAAALTPFFELAETEVRARLSEPLPVILGGQVDPGMATRLRAALRERGHGAVLCDLKRVVASRDMMSPRAFEFAPTSFLALDVDRGTREVSYEEIVALVGARHVSRDEFAQKDDGGERVVYVFRKSGANHVILRESELLYAGLGDRKKSTRARNFNLTIELLKQRTPGAIHDERLVSRPPSAAPGLTLSADVLAVDVAAHLLTIAGLQGQL
jgi:hypothetical protein